MLLLLLFMDRPFKPKYGTVSQVLLQLVVVCLATTDKKTELSEGVGRGSRPRLSHFPVSPSSPLLSTRCTGKNNGFPFLDNLGYLKNTHKNPKFGKVTQVPTREFPTKFPDWNLSHSPKFGFFYGYSLNTLKYPKWESLIFSCDGNWSDHKPAVRAKDSTNLPSKASCCL